MTFEKDAVIVEFGEDAEKPHTRVLSDGRRLAVFEDPAMTPPRARSCAPEGASYAVDVNAGDTTSPPSTTPRSGPPRAKFASRSLRRALLI